MSVLIKGMDMPKSCRDCPLNRDGMYCVVTGTRWLSDTMFLIGFDYANQRLHDCPVSDLTEEDLELINKLRRYAAALSELIET